MFDYSLVDCEMPIGQLVMEIRGCTTLLERSFDNKLFNGFFGDQLIRGRRLLKLSECFLKESSDEFDFRRWQDDLRFNLEGFEELLDRGNGCFRLL
jgi:hypothetical protein